MFTGIVEELGTVATPPPLLTVRCSKILEDLTEGASIAVNGVCLTALDIRRDSFSANISPETLARTNLGALTNGSLVNLERPLRFNDRLSGHLVQGHVDATAELVSLDPLSDGNYWLKLRLPAELDRYLVFKGSVSIDGISLTVASMENGCLGVAIIPHTFSNTTLRQYQPGAKLNVECDILAKHVEKLVIGRMALPGPNDFTGEV